MSTQSTLTIKHFNRDSRLQNLISPEIPSRSPHEHPDILYLRALSPYLPNFWNNHIPKIAFPIFNTYYIPSENNPQRAIPDDSSPKNKHEDSMTLCPHEIFIHLVFTIRIHLHDSHPTTITNEGYFKKHNSIFSIINPDVNFTRMIRAV